jgi:hypothetical protein
MLPSHQAPVLPLKRWRPSWFSGLGLVLGSVAPDLVFVFRLDENGSPAGHTVPGQLYLTVPLVLVLHVLTTALVLPWLLPRVPGGAPLYLHALARSRPATSPAAIARLALSALIGGLTHVALDGFTHGDQSGWALPLLPVLGTPVPFPSGPAPLYDVLQVVLTIALGLAALSSWQAMARELSAGGPGAADARKLRPAARDDSARALALLLGAAVLGAVAAPLLKDAVGTPQGVKLAAYGFVTAGAAASVVAALADRARRVIERVRLEVGSVVPHLSVAIPPKTAEADVSFA